MTCKDCIHYDVCLPRVAVEGDKICKSFKHKTSIIELPFGVGETIKMDLEILCYDELGLNYAEEKLKELNDEH